MTYSFAWVFAFLALERIFEILLSRRNRILAEAAGGKEIRPDTFRRVAVLHGAFFVSLLAESHPWRIPLDLRTGVCLAVLGLLSGIRYWCMASLGTGWNTRIVVVPGRRATRKGPYRFLKHPNYLVVALEFVFFPLLLRAPLTLAAFCVPGVLVLRQRIRLEEEALRQFMEYGKVFPAR